MNAQFVCFCLLHLAIAVVSTISTLCDTLAPRVGLSRLGAQERVERQGVEAVPRQQEDEGSSAQALSGRPRSAYEECDRIDSSCAAIRPQYQICGKVPLWLRVPTHGSSSRLRHPGSVDDGLSEWFVARAQCPLLSVLV